MSFISYIFTRGCFFLLLLFLDSYCFISNTTVYFGWFRTGPIERHKCCSLANKQAYIFLKHILKHFKPLFTGNLCSWLLGKLKSLNPFFPLFWSALLCLSSASLVILFLKSSRYQYAFKNPVILLFYTPAHHSKILPQFSLFFFNENSLLFWSRRKPSMCVCLSRQDRCLCVDAAAMLSSV